MSSDVMENALLDLWAKDIFELLHTGKEEAARSVMRMMGLDESEADGMVKEYRDLAASEAP